LTIRIVKASSFDGIELLIVSQVEFELVADPKRDRPKKPLETWRIIADASIIRMPVENRQYRRSDPIVIYSGSNMDPRDAAMAIWDDRLGEACGWQRRPLSDDIKAFIR